MFSVFGNPAYARLFSAQVIALLGTGLLTVALGLLAYDLAGDAAGTVLGTAYTLKMVAYVGLSPVVGALTERLPRKVVLIGADLVRAGVALSLPFIEEVWQVYALVLVLQSASAAFTPTFQATIPDVLPDEAEYTKALSLSRLAYDIENLISPTVAGLLLLVMSYHGLFAGTFLGFVGSAILVASAVLPRRKPAKERPFFQRLTRGSWIYLSTPRLRGLLAMNLAAAASGAFVLINTVVVARSVYGGGEGDLAVAMASFGAGSMAAALLIPRLLEHRSDRSVMLPAAGALAVLTLGLGLFVSLGGWPGWSVLLLIWAAIGALYSTVLTPSGRLLKRSAHPEDRPAVFTAQFALSHACWLITYPLAGWVGGTLGLGAALLVLGALAALGATAAARLWPAGDPSDLPHDHPDLPADHPHLTENGDDPAHSHTYVIDDQHRRWPGKG